MLVNRKSILFNQSCKYALSLFFLMLFSEILWAAPIIQDYKCYAQASDGEFYLIGGYAASEKDMKQRMTGTMVTNEESGKNFSVQYIPECVQTMKQFEDAKARELDRNSAY